MKVCSFPLNVIENPCIKLMVSGSSEAGVTFVAYDWFLSNFQKFDIFHVHWPDSTVMGRSRLKAAAKFILFILSVLIFRFRGIPIVYTVHNIESHDQKHPVLERALWRVFIPRVSLFHHLNSWSVRELKTLWPTSAPHIVVPHPDYRPILSAEVSRAGARAQLGLPETAFVFLSFGLIRPYKGFKELIRAFSGHRESDAILVLAGRAADPGYAASIRSQAARDERIHFIEGFAEQPQLELMLSACDLVVLAHRRMNNSGIAVMALSAGRPVLGPPMGALLDLREQAGHSWVQYFTDPLSADDLAAARGHVAANISGKPKLDLLEGSHVGRRMAALYRKALAADDRVRSAQHQ